MRRYGQHHQWLGNLKLGEQNLTLAISSLKELSAADPSNVRYRQLVLSPQSALAGLMAENGHLFEAQALMHELESEFDSAGESTQTDNALLPEHIGFLLAYADVEARLGNEDAASSHLRTAMQLQASLATSKPLDRYGRVRLLTARFQWWEIHGEDVRDSMPVFRELDTLQKVEFQSCAEANVAARMFVLEGDSKSAASQVNDLQQRGYAEPSFIRFCKKHELCG